MVQPTKPSRATGVEALPGETQSQYAERQQREHAEAKARMQAKFGSSGLNGLGSGVGGNSSSYGGGLGSPITSTAAAPCPDYSDSSDEDDSSKLILTQWLVLRAQCCTLQVTAKTCLAV